MASTGANFYDSEFNSYDPTLYVLGRDIAAVYEKPLHLLLDAIFYYPPPVSDSDSPQDKSVYGSIFWPQHDLTDRHQSEKGSTLWDDEEKQQPYNGIVNWPNEYDYGIYGCWGEVFKPFVSAPYDNGYTSGWEKAADSNQGNDHCESCYKETEMQPAYDYSPWSGCEFWYGNDAEEEFYYSNLNMQESKPAHGLPDDMGLYQGIFGSWPCFFQKDQKNYDEQEALDYENPWKGTADYLFGNSFRW